MVDTRNVLLTVVIANYNYGQFLPMAIESVVQQCETPEKGLNGNYILPIKNRPGCIELVICDAGSTDNSVEVIKHYNQNIAWWCSEPDGGQSAAFNKGFAKGIGRFVTWLNADEEYLPGTFTALYDKVKKRPGAKWITGNMLMFDTESRTIKYVTWGPHCQPWFFTRNRACLDVFGPTSFIRRDVYNAIGPINEEFHYSMDLEYWARMTMAGIRQTRLNHICWAFGVHDASKSQGAMTAAQIAKGHAENVARETVLGYKYKISFKNPWYLLWLISRILDGSLFVRYFIHLKYIGKKFYGVCNIKGQDQRMPLLYMDRRYEGSNPLRQCQLTQLHLLHVLDRICRKNDLKYFLSWGTLLGARRHGGFIPWDDDLDVGMPMNDFKRLVRIAKRELPKDVYLQAPDDVMGSGYRFAKLRDAYSFYYEPHKRVSTASPNGIYIDIFPFEDCPHIPDWMRRKLGWLASAFYEHQKDNLQKIIDHNILVGLLYYSKALFCAGAHSIVRMIWFLLLRLFPGENITHVLEFWDRNVCFPKEWIKVMPRIQFEDGRFPVPINVDEVLRLHYGDWQTMPPPEKRTTHMSFVDSFHASPSKFAMIYPQK